MPAQRRTSRVIGWGVLLLSAGLTLFFARHIGSVTAGEVFTVTYPWVPSLKVNFSFYLDGLSLLFALLISGIGALVTLYAGGYLANHPQLNRFYLFLFLFMVSMLGLVLANNVITFFVFWELTSLSSYFLIGFDHSREAARSAALQALLVTGLGGLTLLAGLLLLGQAGGSLELSQLLGQGETVRKHALYLPILILILLGAFTKSAQVPFHFWLPNAMEAPTPVSAYLHAATMVKGGVYLLARLLPVLGNTPAWFYTVTFTGAATMVIGAYLALQENNLKKVLAYSTVSALGILTLLLGLGTTPAVKAAAAFLLAHALYKGALFLVAGAIEHETGTRDLEKLGGLGRAMPITGAAAGLAALSMAGFPPFIGFLSKEIFYEALWELPYAAALLAGAILTSILLVAVAGIVGFQPFVKNKRIFPKSPQEAPFTLWLGPAVLALIGLLLGLLPGTVQPLLSAAATASLNQAVAPHLWGWPEFNPPLFLGALTLVGGVGVYLWRNTLRLPRKWLDSLSAWGPAGGYQWTLEALNTAARFQTQVLQNGYLRHYLLIIIAATLGVVTPTLLRQSGLPHLPLSLNLPLYETLLAGLILLATLAAILSPSRLGAIAALGVVGYGVALIFLLFGAPDLAMTQFLIETLTVILFVLVFYHLPRFATLTGKPARVRDALVATAMGGLMSVLVLFAIKIQLHPSIASYFSQNAWSLAHGRNIVNVILVDFRGLDTLGEITVLGIAGIGVYALLKLRAEKGKDT